MSPASDVSTTCSENVRKQSAEKLGPTTEEINAFIAEFDLDAGASRMLRSHRCVEVQTDIMAWMRRTMGSAKARKSVRSPSAIFVKQLVQLDRKIVEKGSADRPNNRQFQAPTPFRPARRDADDGAQSPPWAAGKAATPPWAAGKSATPPWAAAAGRPATPPWRRAEPEKPVKPLRTAEQEAGRKLTSLLNKVTPENMTTMAKQVAEVCSDATIAGKMAERLFFFAGMFSQYSETYADLAVELINTIPGSAASPLRRDIAAVVSSYTVEEAPLEEDKKTHLARGKFVGSLFVRGVVTLGDLDAYMGALLQLGTGAAVECAVQVLKSAGVSLEATEEAREKLAQWGEALVEGKAAQPKRIQFLIEDVVAMASRGWSYRCFDESPQTVDSLHAKHHRDTWGGIVVAPVFEQKVAGTPTAKCIVV